MPDIAARCCIAGGGPAGMMLGFLLARAGIDVVVLEKHGDFLRDFRGDTVHPSTMQVLHELGLLDAFLARPHSEVRELAAQIGEQLFKVADFSHLPTQANFVAFMPQWDFLDFLADHAKRYPTFRLLMNTEATGLMREDDRMVGVTAEGPEGRLEVNAHLTIAADGRHSTLRDGAGFEVVEYGAPMDVLWLRLSKRQNDPGQTLGRVDVGRIFIMLDRGDYWQCAFIIPKGGIDDVHARGLDVFRADITRLAPYLTDRVQELATWDDVKLLTVAVNRLNTWFRPGLLCIGDAAHAMSPVGGVGINLAIQDAVAAANILVPRLREGGATLDDLRAVQRRREPPTRMTQRVQVAIQNRIISNVLRGATTPKPPLAVRLLGSIPMLRRLPARIIGMGFRPEHIRH
ncbi:MAG TPA: FAD-dependent oxidoreductase [Acetobacteraceae bacterium]|jgi:2-polyprenyl-6-methoxyphenol hydroxylase-like FAD-dependent oxidoreductase|nr:FAD-dependent oxidoreductase [Acetobacteraceae bacterium]